MSMKSASLSLNAGPRKLKAKLRENVLLSVGAGLAGTALGVVFLYAGVKKHLAPAQFAEALLAYQLLPSGLAGLAAAVLPWLELTAGFFLVLGYVSEALGRGAAAILGRPWGAAFGGGIKRRSCLLLIAALALLFIMVMAVTLARGLKIDCGCGLFFQRQVGALPIAENCLMLAVAAALYWWEYPGD
jgi:putative oxidoreductase